MPITRSSQKQTRFQKAFSQLKEMALRADSGSQLPTILQLRDLLGISNTTLDSVLRELEAQNVVERRHGVGIFVSSRPRIQCIALLCEPLFFRNADASPFWSLLIEHAGRRAAQKQEEINVHFANPIDRGRAEKGRSKGRSPLPSGLSGAIQAGQVQGLLSIGLLRQEAAGYLSQLKIPCVTYAGYGDYTVDADSLLIPEIGVNSLVQQGCRKIGLWSPVTPHLDIPLTHAYADEVLDRFKQALQRAGTPFYPELVENNLQLLDNPVHITCEPLQTQGYQTALRVFGHTEKLKPDGIVVFDDIMTQGALMALQPKGVQVGKEVKIATLANVGSPVFLGMEERLTFIDVDPAGLIQKMFDMLEILMEGKEPENPHVILQPRLRQQRV